MTDKDFFTLLNRMTSSWGNWLVIQNQIWTKQDTVGTCLFSSRWTWLFSRPRIPILHGSLDRKCTNVINWFKTSTPFWWSRNGNGQLILEVLLGLRLHRIKSECFICSSHHWKSVSVLLSLVIVKLITIRQCLFSSSDLLFFYTVVSPTLNSDHIRFGWIIPPCYGPHV